MKTLWIARDKSGRLYLFQEKPVKGNNVWKNKSDSLCDYSSLPEDMFPEVKWEDEEPIEIMIVKKENINPINAYDTEQVRKILDGE